MDGRPVQVTVGSEVLEGRVEGLAESQVTVAGRAVDMVHIAAVAAPTIYGRFAVEIDEKAPPRDDTDPMWEDPPGSVEDRVADGDDIEPEERIEGTSARPQLTLLAGGEEPDSSSFKMQGGKVNVEGQFDKGDVIDLIVKVRVAEVDFVDKHDNDGYVVGTDRRHIAKPLSIRRYVEA